MSLRQASTEAEPAIFTSADLLINDDLPALDRVCQYTSATVALMRLVHVSMLSDVAQDVGFETMVTRIFPLLPKLCNDDEWVVRNKVAPEISTMCQLSIALGAGKGYDLVVTQLLPLLAKLAGDVHSDVRASGAKALAMISMLLKPDDLAVHLFTIVIELANAEGQDGTAEDLRMAAAELMELLAPHLGEELCEQFVVPTMQNLSEDDSFRVRKSVALHLSKIISTCIFEVNDERLIPMFLTLSNDEMWVVRKACAESIMDISLAMEEKEDRLMLVRTMVSLLEDDTRWVSDAAYSHLGPFITTLPIECLTLSSSSSNKDNQRLLALYKQCASWEGYGDSDDNQQTSGDGSNKYGSNKNSYSGNSSNNERGKYSKRRERASRNGSTVVDISIKPPFFKLVSLSSPRSLLSKTPKHVIF